MTTGYKSGSTKLNFALGVENMREKIFKIALILTVVCQVYSENEDELKSGLFVVTTKGTTKSTDVLAKENKTEFLLSLTNTGDLIDGMINTNVSNSNDLRSVFASMKSLNVTTRCNLMDYTLFVVRVCQEKEKEQVQENQEEEEEPPKGTYNSTIEILQETHYFDGLWTLRFSIVVEYNVKLSNKKAYESCSRKRMIKSLEKVQGVNKIGNIIIYKGSQAETTLNKEDEFKIQRIGADDDNDGEIVQVLEDATSHEKANKSIAKSVPFLKPIYIKIKVKLTRKIKDLKEGQTSYYTFFDFQNQCVIIRAGKFKDGYSSSKTIVRVTGLNLVIEASAKEDEHTFLIYDNRFEYLQLPNRKDPVTKKAYQVVASYVRDVFNKVTQEKKTNGTLFSFHISSEQRNQGRSLDQILVYVSNVKKTAEHPLRRPFINNLKASLCGCFHIKTDANNTIIHGKKVQNVEKVRNMESCNLCPIIIDKWLMDAVSGNELMVKNAHQEQDAKPPNKLSKVVTCGTVTIEVSRGDNYDLSGPIPKQVFVFFLKSQKALNQDGKEIRQEHKNEEKLKKRDILPKGEESAKYAYEILELLQPVFDKNVQSAIANIRQSISAKYGKGIWGTAEYMSELKITRNAACTDISCQGSIRAVLQYNLTRKAMPIKRMDLRPKVNFEMLLRFQFFAKVIIPQPLPTALMKHQYNPRYRAQKMPMIKLQQAATPFYATTNMPPTLNKAFSENSLQKLRFKAKGKRYPSDQHTFLDYERTMEKDGQLKNTPLIRKTPDFQVSNNNFQEYRDGEVNYKKQQREVLKRAEENKQMMKKSNSGYALSVGKNIMITLVICFLLFKL